MTVSNKAAMAMTYVQHLFYTYRTAVTLPVKLVKGLTQFL